MKKNKVTAVVFNHATIDGATVPIFANQFFTCFKSGTANMTYIMAPGGGIVPVKESQEEVLRRITEALNKQETEGEINNELPTTTA